MSRIWQHTDVEAQIEAPVLDPKLPTPSGVAKERVCPMCSNVIFFRIATNWASIWSWFIRGLNPIVVTNVVHPSTTYEPKAHMFLWCIALNLSNVNITIIPQWLKLRWYNMYISIPKDFAVKLVLGLSRTKSNGLSITRFTNNEHAMIVRAVTTFIFCGHPFTFIV